MVAAAVMGGVLSAVANVAAGVYSMQAAAQADRAAASCDAAGNETNSSLLLLDAANGFNTQAGTAQSVQAGCEALTLLLLAVTFLIIVSWSVALFRVADRVAAHALLSVADHTSMPPAESNAAAGPADTMQAAAQQRRRLVAACVIVLFTFPARAAFDLLSAWSNFNSPPNLECHRCAPCQSTPYLIAVWLQYAPPPLTSKPRFGPEFHRAPRYTPELQAIIVALGSALPLALCLWLLTKAHTRALLIAADVRQRDA